MGWVQRAISRDVRSVGPSLRATARYYTEVRLKVSQPSGTVKVNDRRLGRPIPYLAFWFGDAFGLADDRLLRLAALSLVRSTISTTIRDDVSESPPSARAGLKSLSAYWHKKHIASLSEVFPTGKDFRDATHRANEEWRKYDSWETAPLGEERLRPFSARFLGESSRFYLACALPPLAALACAGDRRGDIPRIEDFLRNFSMGWKIFDDLMDWETDLATRDLNRSSVLMSVQNGIGEGKDVDRFDTLSWFMNRRFVEEAYGAMLGFFGGAREASAGFRNRYLDTFLEEQMALQSDKRELLLASGASRLSELNEGLSLVLGRESRRRRGSPRRQG